MKKIFTAMIALLLTCGAMAQTKMSNTLLKDGAIMKNGKMMVIQNGRTRPMDKNITLSDGSIVTVTGNISTSDGKTIPLNEGDAVTMTGQIQRAIKKETP